MKRPEIEQQKVKRRAQTREALSITGCGSRPSEARKALSQELSCCWLEQEIGGGATG